MAALNQGWRRLHDGVAFVARRRTGFLAGASRIVRIGGRHSIGGVVVDAAWLELWLGRSSLRYPGGTLSTPPIRTTDAAAVGGSRFP